MNYFFFAASVLYRCRSISTYPKISILRPQPYCTHLLTRVPIRIDDPSLPLRCLVLIEWHPHNFSILLALLLLSLLILWKHLTINGNLLIKILKGFWILVLNNSNLFFSSAFNILFPFCIWLISKALVNYYLLVSKLIFSFKQFSIYLIFWHLIQLESLWKKLKLTDISVFIRNLIQNKFRLKFA